MNFANLGSYQIIARFPSKYDVKDSFKAASTKGIGIAGVRAIPARRAVSEKHALASQSVAASRTVSGPIKTTDLVRLVVQNVPIALSAADLFAHLEHFGDLQTVALAYDNGASGDVLDTRKPLGIGVAVYAKPEEANRAMQELNGQYLLAPLGANEASYRATQPLFIRLWEPRGSIETSLALSEPIKAEYRLQAGAQPFVPAGGILERREVSFSSNASTVVSPKASQIAKFSESTAGDLPPDLRKHKRLLQTALEELPPNVQRDIGTQMYRLHSVAEVLVQKLTDEGDRKRCIFDEAFLIDKVKEALSLVVDPDVPVGPAKVEASPSRMYDRGKLLNVRVPKGGTGCYADEEVPSCTLQSRQEMLVWKM